MWALNNSSFQALSVFRKPLKSLLPFFCSFKIKGSEGWVHPWDQLCRLEKRLHPLLGAPSRVVQAEHTISLRDAVQYKRFCFFFPLKHPPTTPNTKALGPEVFQSHSSPLFHVITTKSKPCVQAGPCKQAGFSYQSCPRTQAACRHLIVS